eukprot:1825489-Pleurochrysis_carterae.AAC.12
MNNEASARERTEKANREEGWPVRAGGTGRCKPNGVQRHLQRGRESAACSRRRVGRGVVGGSPCRLRVVGLICVACTRLCTRAGCCAMTRVCCLFRTAVVSMRN